MGFFGEEKRKYFCLAGLGALSMTASLFWGLHVTEKLDKKQQKSAAFSNEEVGMQLNKESKFVFNVASAKPEQEEEAVQSMVEKRELPEEKEDACYEVVVKEQGGISQIGYSEENANANHYICYLEDGDEDVTIWFKIQRIGAVKDEKTAILLCEKTVGKEVIPLSEGIDGWSENINHSEVPVQEKNDFENGVWDQWVLPLKNRSISDFDGTVLIIALSEKENSQIVRENSVCAEIELVERDLFELD